MQDSNEDLRDRVMRDVGDALGRAGDLEEPHLGRRLVIDVPPRLAFELSTPPYEGPDIGRALWRWTGSVVDVRPQLAAATAENPATIGISWRGRKLTEEIAVPAGCLFLRTCCLVLDPTGGYVDAWFVTYDGDGVLGGVVELPPVAS